MTKATQITTRRPPHYTADDRMQRTPHLLSSQAIPTLPPRCLRPLARAALTRAALAVLLLSRAPREIAEIEVAMARRGR